MMCNIKGIEENEILCHRPLQSLNTLEFDREKSRFLRPRNRAQIQDESNKKHRSALRIRLFLREFCLHCVKSMLTNTDEVIVRAATTIKSNIFYMQGYLEQISPLLRDYDNMKMTSAYFQDLVRHRRAARKATSTKKKNDETTNHQISNLEEKWQNQLSKRLSSLLQGLEEITVSKWNLCPFDALSEVPVDDQSITALTRIYFTSRQFTTTLLFLSSESIE